jgi:hypothetical protein
MSIERMSVDKNRYGLRYSQSVTRPSRWRGQMTRPFLHPAANAHRQSVKDAFSALVEILRNAFRVCLVRLKRFVARQSKTLTYVERFSQARRRIVRSANRQ